MRNPYSCIPLLCALALLGCFSGQRQESSSSAELPQLGIAVKLPENFSPLPRENLREAGSFSLIEADPFTPIPLYGYRESDGKGVLIISQLELTEGAEAEKYPLDTVFIYKKNIERYFGVEEIATEEISNQDITVVLLAMMFGEGEEAISLFKGLCFKYPDRYFMLDLYVVNALVTRDDAFRFQELFNSLSSL